MISKSFRCLSCEETFYDRETLLSHLGVKHNLINRVLEEKSLPRIPLDQVQIHFQAFNLIRQCHWFQVILEQVGNIKREPTFVEPQNLLRNCQTEQQLGIVPSSDRSQCEVCGGKFLATNKLAQHMCAHFLG